MADDMIGYEQLMQDALRSVVRAALQEAASPRGLPGKHHFYITFRTHAPGVIIPEHLRARYPDEMTIVLEHQFWDLAAEEEIFGVTLSFKGRRQRITVPYAALTAFHDPGVQFGLRFDQMQEGEEKGAAQAGRPAAGAAPTPLPAPTAKPEPATPSDEPKTAQVVNLESFRKK